MSTFGNMQCELGKAYWKTSAPGKLCCVSVHTAPFVFTRRERLHMKNRSSARADIYPAITSGDLILSNYLYFVFTPILSFQCIYGVGELLQTFFPSLT